MSGITNCWISELSVCAGFIREVFMQEKVKCVHKGWIRTEEGERAFQLCVIVFGGQQAD